MMISPRRVVMHLRRRLFMAYLAGCVFGEYLNSKTPLSASTAFLAAPHVAVLSTR